MFAVSSSMVRLSRETSVQFASGSPWQLNLGGYFMLTMSEVYVAAAPANAMAVQAAASSRPSSKASEAWNGMHDSIDSEASAFMSATIKGKLQFDIRVGSYV